MNDLKSPHLVKSKLNLQKQPTTPHIKSSETTPQVPLNNLNSPPHKVDQRSNPIASDITKRDNITVECSATGQERLEERPQESPVKHRKDNIGGKECFTKEELKEQIMLLKEHVSFSYFPLIIHL